MVFCELSCKGPRTGPRGLGEAGGRAGCLVSDGLRAAARSLRSAMEPPISEEPCVATLLLKCVHLSLARECSP